jgi:hypothetical protein
MATHQRRDGDLRAGDEILNVKSEQERANQLFLERAELLPGILRMEQHEDRITRDRSFRISVRDGDRDTEYAIYGLEAEIYHLYPRTYLNVRVLAERDIAVAEAEPDTTAR